MPKLTISRTFLQQQLLLLLLRMRLLLLLSASATNELSAPGSIRKTVSGPGVDVAGEAQARQVGPLQPLVVHLLVRRAVPGRPAVEDGSAKGRK